MSEDVVDIRKRIEEIRNEVSSASISQREQPRSRTMGNIAELAVAQGSAQYQDQTDKVPENAVPQDAPQNDTKAALDSALQMPAFTLNVKNQVSNKTLFAFCIIQTLSNIAIIGVLLWKLG
ncbi:hypothetical protein [uncultured Candidatus Puniceispirillum sp.]|uniref:hypothetical protein n=1 Tax=uncultured Candidatus Puniceispirillum sp. TaxID=1985115 RepID=UPI0032B13C94